jgi:HlyD family secretion protein
MPQTSTTPVRRGTITATINLAGSTAAMSQSQLSFETTGRLAELLVKVGDSVKTGDVLAKVDTADLELQVSQAQVALDQAKVKLDQLKAGPSAVDLAAAQATYDNAVNKYNEVKAGPKPEDVAAAQAAVRDAEVALANAQDNLIVVQKSATVSKDPRDRQNEANWYEARYGETLAKFNQNQATQADLDRDYNNLMTAKERLDAALAAARLALSKAQNDVDKANTALSTAKTNLATLLQGPTPEELKAAEAAMLTAQAQLEAKTNGTSAIDIAAQEVAVRLAESALRQKQLQLEKATLRAPFDGVIDSIGVSLGQQVSTSATAITIVNLQRFRIDARVSESDVSRITVGQTAAVTLEALPQERLMARVTSIVVTPVTSQGVVNYPVVLELDPSNAAVRPGMTANVVVEVARVEDVLLVPNRAVKQQGRSRTVDVMVDGKKETRTVTVGMSNDQYTEITDGLNEGDLVVVTGTTTAAPRVPQSGGFTSPQQRGPGF